MSEEITLAESSRLIALEETIKRGIATFIEVGEALAAIRDEFSRKFDQLGYKDFEDYCKTKWGMARRTAYQFISGAEVAANVRNCAQVEPVAESQVRPLVSLPKEQQVEAWSAAVETAKTESPTGKPTAKIVEAEVERIQGRAEPTTTKQDPPAYGMQYALMAEIQIKKISRNDPERAKAFAYLTKCIADNLK